MPKSIDRSARNLLWICAIALTLCSCSSGGSPGSGDAGTPDGAAPDAAPTDGGPPDGSASSDKAITAFSFSAAANAALTADAIVSIDGTEIAAAVPNDTDVTALVASFTHTGVSVAVGTSTQQSGVTANDFSAPVTCTVSAEDGSTQDFLVTVSNAHRFSAGPVAFTMAHIQGGLTFPVGTNDSGSATVADGYYIGHTEMTYSLWYAVRTWAENTADPSYAFANAGDEGDDGTTGAGPTGSGTDEEPVTTINWRDAMVWTNALTEYYNAQNGTSLVPVYTHSSTVIRDSRDANAAACDNALVAATADGFRLPSIEQWELAARYITDDGDGTLDQPGEYYPGNHASGADAEHDAASGASDLDGDGDVEYSSDVAIYGATGGHTATVKSKSPNALGLFDMSGNVREWVATGSTSGGCTMATCRAVMGGSYSTPSDWMQVGDASANLIWVKISALGFRIVKAE